MLSLFLPDLEAGKKMKLDSNAEWHASRPKTSGVQRSVTRCQEAEQTNLCKWMEREE